MSKEIPLQRLIATLFSAGETGAVYDPSDFSTLFQNSTGTTPVTAVEQPVGLMLDRSGRGNHATAPNDASRPVLRARYNLLTQSDDLTSYSITPATGLTSTLNATTAPTGAATARRLTNTVTTEFHRLFQGVTLTSGAEYTYTVYLKSDTAGWAQMSFFRGSTTAFANINLATGALGTTGGGTSYSVTSVGNGWYRLSVTATTEAAGCNLQLYVLEADSVTANPSTTGTVKSIFVWGAQLLTAADQTSTGGAYQRIAAATDYDVSNPVWRPYLAFDGTDDSFSTSAIDFSATDEMTVFAGVTKLSDANDAMLVELSANTASNAGSFYITAPEISGGNSTNVRFKNRGSLDPGLPSAATFAAPGTRVLRAYGDISGDTASVFLNGSSVATTTGDQGTGNYGNYPLFIGRRNNASLPLNGRLYSLAVLGRTASAAELSAMEAWVNGKTGAY